MLTSLFHAGSFSLMSVLMTMAVSVLLGVMIALIYKLHAVSSSTYINILAVMPLLISLVIMIVNGNLGTSVAVLGAFGLVRFRSGTGTAREIGYLFFAMTTGLALGMGFLTLAVIIVAVVGLVLLVGKSSGFEVSQSTQRQLRITIPEDLNDIGLFDDLFSQYARKVYLERIKTTNMGTMFELCYRIDMYRNAQVKELMDEIRCRNGNLNVSISMVEKQRNEF